MVQDDLQATARLAHLDLTEDEVAAALPAFEQMLGYFAAMRMADSDELAFGAPSGSSVSSKVSSAGNRLRADNNNNNNLPTFALANELLNSAPEREDRFLVVPNVL